MFPICHTHLLALFSHRFKSATCVYSVIFSLQRRCRGCRVPFSNPRCFLLVTVYGTTHAHLVHVCWPLLWSLRQMGRNFATLGIYALVASLPAPKVRAKPAPKQTGRVAQAGAKPAAKPAVPPFYQPHTLCPLCKLTMCNSSKCAILVPRNSLPFFWTPNNIRVGVVRGGGFQGGGQGRCHLSTGLAMVTWHFPLFYCGLNLDGLLGFVFGALVDGFGGFGPLVVDWGHLAPGSQPCCLP